MFTTRNRRVVVDLIDSDDDILSVSEMNHAETLELLGKELSDGQMRDTANTTNLLTFLANLLLAIKQTSAYQRNISIIVDLETRT